MKLCSIAVPLGVAALLFAATAVNAAEPAATPPSPAGAPVAPMTPAPKVDREAEILRIRSGRGVKVCRDTSSGLSRYSGTVQASERGKIQVLVTAETEKASGKEVTSFHQTNVWDDPANWSLCE